MVFSPFTLHFVLSWQVIMNTRSLFDYWYNSFLRLRNGFLASTAQEALSIPIRLYLATMGVVVGAITCYYFPLLPLSFSFFFFKKVLAVPVPIISIVLSSLYVPFLFHLYHLHTGVHAPAGVKNVIRNIFFYIIAGSALALLYNVWLNASESMVVGMVLVAIMTGPLLGLMGFVSPFALLAYTFESDKCLDHTTIWRYGIAMSIKEFPLMVILYIGLTPLFSLFCYILYFAHEHQWGLFASEEIYRLLLHTTSILYWQYTWSLFMATYLRLRHDHHIPQACLLRKGIDA